MPIDPLTIASLTMLKFFTAFLGVIVGGGGLVLIPVMIGLGVPAVESVATARVSNFGQGVTSLWVFNRERKLDWRLGTRLAGVAAVSVYLSSVFVLTLNEALLTRLIGMMILALLVIVLLSQRLGLDEKRKAGPARQALGHVILFVAVFVANITGSSGILVSYVLIFLFGKTFLKALGTRKIVNMVGIIAATSVFVFAGVVVWELAIPFLISGSLGGWLGSKYVIKVGNVWYKRVFIVIVAILAVRMLIV